MLLVAAARRSHNNFQYTRIQYSQFVHSLQVVASHYQSMDTTPLTNCSRTAFHRQWLMSMCNLNDRLYLTSELRSSSLTGLILENESIASHVSGMGYKTLKAGIEAGVRF